MPLVWKPVGNEFVVNTTTAGDQSASAVAKLSDGRFIVSWNDFSGSGGDVSGAGVRAQLFTADGQKIGAEVLVNTTTVKDQGDSAVAGLGDGRFVLTWTDLSASEGDVRGRVFEADGIRRSGEFQVNSTMSLGQGDSAIAAIGGSRFVVAWTDSSRASADVSGTAVRGQIVDASGARIGPEFLVNTTTLANQSDAAVAALSDGRFVITWTDYSSNTGSVPASAIRAQIFSQDGSRSGAEILVGSATSAYVSESAVAALGNGQFVVTWTYPSYEGGDLQSIRGQVFNPTGGRSGAEFIVNTTTWLDQTESSVAALGDGRFVVTWTDSSVLDDVRGQIFTAAGQKSGVEFVVNTTADRFQTSSSTAALGNGLFAVTWTDSSRSGLDASGSAIRGQVIDAKVYVGTAANETVFGGALADSISGAGGADVLSGGAGDDVFDGGSGDDQIEGGEGKDTALYSGAISEFAILKSGAVWTIAQTSSGSADTLRDVEVLKFSDRTFALVDPLPVAVSRAYSNILRTGFDKDYRAFNDLNDKITAGMLSPTSAIADLIKAADATTSVATLAYQFFTGKIPSAAGIDYLVSPTGPNANNLNSAYYQSFSIENRYINFAVNLGKLGEGKDAFAAAFGAKTLAEATRDAYAKIFGSTPTDAKISALLNPSFVLNGQTLTRAEYFAYYGQDGASGIGTKAAMVGWLLSEAVKADLGTYSKSNDAFLLDLADGATFAVDLVGTYGKPEFAYVG